MELNKIAAAILLAGLIGMVTGKVAGILYDGGQDLAHGYGHEEVKRGYAIEVVEAAGDAAAGAPKEKELASIIPLLPSADTAAGEQYFSKKCSLCHTHEKGGANKTGPNLWGIVGSKKAHLDNFNYSKAMSEKGGVWGFEELNGFLHKPKQWLPGTIMAYAGTRKEEERANLISYLRSLSDNPVPIPAAPAPADEETPAE